MTTTQFPCPSCQCTASPADERCPACGWRFDAMPDFLPTPVARPRLPVMVEFAIAIDRTGSTKVFASGTQAMIREILHSIEPKVQSSKVWVQTHGDEDYGQEPVLLTDGGDIEQAIADVQTIVFEGGGDPEEHHLDAIETAFRTIPWSNDRRRVRGVMICFLTADSKPSRKGLSPESIGGAISQQGILLYVVAQRTPLVSAFCQAAKGMFVEISNDPSPDDIERIAAAIGASIAATVATGKTTPIAAMAATRSN